MESFDSRWERDQRRRQARDNDEAAPKKVWAEAVRDCSRWENSTREYTEETRGQLQWNLEPKEDGTKIDPTVYSTPSKKVRCML